MTKFDAQYGIPVIRAISPYANITADLDGPQQACWVAGQYGDITFRDGDGCGPTFELLFSRVVNAIRDSDLPVVLAVVSYGVPCILMVRGATVHRPDRQAATPRWKKENRIVDRDSAYPIHNFERQQ